MAEKNERTSFPVLRLPIPVREDRLPKALIERVLAAQEPRHQEVEQAPQLEDVVLDRRAGEDEPVVRLDALHRARELRARVLDDVALVEHAVVPPDTLERRDVVPHDLVARDHDVVRVEARGEALPLARGADVHHGPQVRGVLEDLVVPVACERRRTHDERG